MKKNRAISVLAAILIGFLTYPAFSQNSDKNFDEIENWQDKIEDLYVEVYKIMDTYPEVTYNYVYDDGDVTEVTIKGIPDNRDKKQLEVYLIDLEDMKREIFNLSNRVGVHYVTETEPQPKMGYMDFYDKLHSNLTYPKSAEDEGVEGTIFVKFVVDNEGNVENMVVSEDIESPGKWIVKDLKEEAKKAVKATSGDWIPAKVGGISVSQWVVLPVQFKLESPYFRPLY